MRKLYCFIVVLVLGLMAASAWADVPYPPNCLVQWRDPSVARRPRTRTISPRGNADYLDISVRDQYNQPMAGVTVTVTFDNPYIILKTVPLSGITNLAGVARINVAGGINYAGVGGTRSITSKVHVRCLGFEIYDPDDSFLSPDFNGDLKVNSADFSFFADDWLRVEGDCHSNFSGEPGTGTENVVDSQDFACFSSYWLDE